MLLPALVCLSLGNLAGRTDHRPSRSRLNLQSCRSTDAPALLSSCNSRRPAGIAESTVATRILFVKQTRQHESLSLQKGTLAEASQLRHADRTGSHCARGDRSTIVPPRATQQSSGLYITTNSFAMYIRHPMTVSSKRLSFKPRSRTLISILNKLSTQLNGTGAYR
ncbi:hypothetical protein FA95DRAFT_533052 [Auriscalpium vulgare]|uniref:Uncharacterized protein n=1 Tax=Auriscalpium vulgare TaxID=40419 RepID=A0ACB8RFW3_9AGAM|nr:hypothetical protein FA95DRAFT_533052 [Auriscalpium vulgare]